MEPTARRRMLATAGLLLAHVPSPVLAQSVPEPPASASPATDASAPQDGENGLVSSRDQATKKQEAERRFRLGVSLFKQGSVDGALAEFAASAQLYPTQSAGKNAAVCLKKLHRFDEAMDQYEQVLATFPDMESEERNAIQSELRELEQVVGELDVQLKEEGAEVVVDGRSRGTAPLKAPIRVSIGSHVLRVSKPGFLPFEAQVQVAGGQRRVVAGKLDLLSPHSSLNQQVPHRQAEPKTTTVPVAVHAGPALAPSLTGGISKQCSSPCSASLPWGTFASVRGAYPLGRNWEAGLDIGAFTLSQTVNDRDAVLRGQPSGLYRYSGQASDHLRWTSLMLGFGIGWHQRSRWTRTFRLVGGVCLGTLNDTRSGVFSTDPTGAPTESKYDQPSSSQSFAAHYAYVGPEVQFGYRLGPSLEVAAGLSTFLLMALQQPRWTTDVNAPRPVGLASYGDQSLVGAVLVWIAPQASVRWEF